MELKANSIMSLGGNKVNLWGERITWRCQFKVFDTEFMWLLDNILP